MRTTTITAAALLAAALLTGCGGSTTPRPTVTVTETVTAPPGAEDEDAAKGAPEDAPVGEARETKDIKLTSAKWITDQIGEKIYRIQFTVKNSSSKKSDYYVLFELLNKAGDRVGEADGYVEALAPGQTTKSTAEHYPENDPNKDSATAVKARAVTVDRMSSVG